MLAFAFCGLCFTSYARSGQPEADPKTVPALLAPEKMREDLDYTVKILRNVHPATYHGFSGEQQAVIDAAYHQIQEPKAINAFYFIVNSVICSLQDGHTNLRPRGDNQNRRIDVPIIWLRDGFYVQEDREPFQRGDRIVAIGGKGIDAIYQQMRALIPAENEHYRKWGMAGKIQREEFLDYLGVIENDAVEIGIERAGNGITLSAPLKPPVPRQPGQSSRPWVGYQIDADLSLGIFHLDTCNPNDQYTKTLRAFFAEVSEKNIRNIAVDVRRNGGGNSRVIDEFFTYLKIGRYRSYGGDIRYSKEVAQKVGYTRTSGYERGRPHQMRNDKVKDSKLLFDGKLFVLTSTQTFSSGNWFAVTVKDNGLGTIIGEPTGNAPSSYGDVPSFQMPNTGFSFSVSHKKFVRPNPDNDPEDALYPDIPVYTTIDDVIHGSDPQIEKLKAIVKEGPK
ncbi:MAG: hypothetical protein A2Y77_00645 [Planctomycetes bacterium RBG_13_62_9]|nr:MAG: hypothetical protein A2Y77_00645 [Planctomycetes bacterium RBG_13_62_9]